MGPLPVVAVQPARKLGDALSRVVVCTGVGALAQEPDGAVARLVAQDLRVGDAGGVVDGDAHVPPAAAVDGDAPITNESTTDTRD